MKTMKLAASVRKIRKLHDMTQSEFADEIGVGAEHISNVECGVRGFGEDTLRKICKRFSVSMDDLLSEKNYGSDDRKKNAIDEIVNVLESLDTKQAEMFRDMFLGLRK